MKALLALFLITSCVDAASTNAVKKTQPAPADNGTMVKEHETKINEPNTLDKKEEDCDTKAKKPVEITPEAISLSGTTGCTLDEAKP